MKYLGQANKILGINIRRNREKKTLTLSHEDYLVKVLKRFNMFEAKSIETCIGQHFMLTSEQFPTTQEEKFEMSDLPYTRGVGSIMYRMVCKRPDLVYTISMVSRFMANPRRPH